MRRSKKFVALVLVGFCAVLTLMGLGSSAHAQEWSEDAITVLNNPHAIINMSNDVQYAVKKEIEANYTAVSTPMMKKMEAVFFQGSLTPNSHSPNVGFSNSDGSQILQMSHTLLSVQETGNDPAQHWLRSFARPLLSIDTKITIGASRDADAVRRISAGYKEMRIRPERTTPYRGFRGGKPTKEDLAYQAKLDAHIAKYGSDPAKANTDIISIGASTQAVVTWHPKSRKVRVRWRQNMHMVSITAIAPSVSGAKSHGVSQAKKVDGILEESGFFDFPTITVAAPKPDAPMVKILAADIIDANPLFAPKGKTYIDTWTGPEIVSSRTVRKGTSADGVSQLVIRAELSNRIPVTFEITGEGNGKTSPLFDGKVISWKGRHYAFALYMPPETFDENIPRDKRPQSSLSPPDKRLNGTLAVRDIRIIIKPKSGSGKTSQVTFLLARPPVVLVHGLFSDPIKTWVDTFENGRSLTALLERAGFIPFLVNYQDTNGTEQSGSWMMDDKNRPSSSFQYNRNVVWDSPLKDYTPVVYEYSWLGSEPVYQELKKPKNIYIGGISQALKYYRDEMNLASTQAIVVGHSMGGILARVWASESYNPNYKRPENFMVGDIDRLLTLNTPHHGSELVELKDAVEKEVINDEIWLEWARRKLVNTVAWWYMSVEPKAVTDLRPQSKALAKIGATKLPAFAITTTVNTSELGDTNKDPYKHYLSLYSAAGTVFFNNRSLLNEFIEKRYEDWQAYPKQQASDFAMKTASEREVYKNIVAANIDNNAYYWAKRLGADYQRELETDLGTTKILTFGMLTPGMGNDGELDLLSTASVISKAATGSDITRFFDDDKVNDLPETFIPILRDMIFHHDQDNDGTVRLVSQVGDAGRTENFEGVVHSYSPWDKKVQQKILYLLRWDADTFDPNGFPAAGKLTPRYLPNSDLSVDRIYGEHAVKWSGMVASHAREYLRVADEEHTLVLVRPVNPSSTGLLADNAAAKGMNIKGKSSSWGPQVGYIPVDQRFSKLWRVIADKTQRKDAIKEYNEQTKKSLETDHPKMPGKTYAVARNLEKQTTQGLCQVLSDPGEDNAEKAIVFQCGDNYFAWQTAKDARGEDVFDAKIELTPRKLSAEQIARVKSNPLAVLADGTQPDRNGETYQPYLTADYDLLAIGAYHGNGCKAVAKGGCHNESNAIGAAKFDPIRGFIGPKQLSLLTKMNAGVIDNTGYTSGWVTHHGPENQYAKSPYVDYPILVFDPVSKKRGDGVAYLVRQGPPGFRDIHLKRLFTEKIRLGFNLWPNPNSNAWKWEGRQKFDLGRGYDPRDISDLPPYVKEAPAPEKTASASRTETTRQRPNLKPRENVSDGKTETGETIEKPMRGSFWKRKIGPFTPEELTVKRYESWRTVDDLLYNSMPRSGFFHNSKRGFLKNTTGELRQHYKTLLKEHSFRDITVNITQHMFYTSEYVCSFCTPENGECTVLAYVERRDLPASNSQIAGTQSPVTASKVHMVLKVIPVGFQRKYKVANMFEATESQAAEFTKYRSSTCSVVDTYDDYGVGPPKTHERFLELQAKR